MARFLSRSQLALVSPILAHHCRSSTNDEGLFSNEYLEERNEIHRKVKQLAKDVVILSCDSTAKGGVCDVYVVGTAHCSPESCKEVQAIMSYLKPQVLFLELCESRSPWLQQELNDEKFSVMDLVKAVMHNRINIIEAQLQWMQQKYTSQWKECKTEFFVAYQEAIKYSSTVVLGDRPLEVTTERLSRKLSIWQKSVCFQKLDKDFIEHTLLEVFIDERDKYMAYQLLEVARKNRSIVAIVGKAHLEGVKKYWKQPIEVEDLEDLMSIPPPIPPSKFCLLCHGVITGIGIIAVVGLGAKILLSKRV